MSGLLRSYLWECTMCGIVLLDVCCYIVDVDARAAQEQTPQVSLIISTVCLVFQSCEVLMELLCFGPRSMVFDLAFLLHLSAVLFGFIQMVAGVQLLRPFLEIWRILLLLGSVRRLASASLSPKKAAAVQLVLGFPEFYLQQTVWAMLMVELVYPLVVELQARDFRCDRCPYSVFAAQLLLFELVVAGDGWDSVAGPLIRFYPATSLVFIGSFLCLLFHLINVFVSTFVVMYKSKMEIQQKVLAKIFEDMDQRTGELTLDQLLEGAASCAAFQRLLRVLDMDENDLCQLFNFMSGSNSAVKSAELVKLLSSWQQESATAVRFLNCSIQQSMRLREDFRKLEAKMEGMSGLDSKIEELLAHLRPISPPQPKA